MLMMRDYCLSVLLIISSQIGCYRFCGCICTAFSYSKWLPLQYQCTFNQNSIVEASLPSSSQGAAACRSSGFFCSYPRIALVALSRIDIPAASRKAATKTKATKTTATKIPLCFYYITTLHRANVHTI
jgi:hypothetical protein